MRTTSSTCCMRAQWYVPLLCIGLYTMSSFLISPQARWCMHHWHCTSSCLLNAASDAAYTYPYSRCDDLLGLWQICRLGLENCIKFLKVISYNLVQSVNIPCIMCIYWSTNAHSTTYMQWMSMWPKHPHTHTACNDTNQGSNITSTNPLLRPTCRI